MHDNLESMKVLLGAGCDPNDLQCSGETILHVCASRPFTPFSLSCARLLLWGGAEAEQPAEAPWKTDVDLWSMFMGTPLYQAVLRNHRGMVKVLLDAGADIMGPPALNGVPIITMLSNYTLATHPVHFRVWAHSLLKELRDAHQVEVRALEEGTHPFSAAEARLQQEAVVQAECAYQRIQCNGKHVHECILHLSSSLQSAKQHGWPETPTSPGVAQVAAAPGTELTPSDPDYSTLPRWLGSMLRSRRPTPLRTLRGRVVKRRGKRAPKRRTPEDLIAVGGHQPQPMSLTNWMAVRGELAELWADLAQAASLRMRTLRASKRRSYAVTVALKAMRIRLAALERAAASAVQVQY